MARGKHTCRILKDIRRQIAEANDIDFVTAECRYKGDCPGTCPRCEEEVRYLEQQLRARSLSGKAIALAGISAGALAMLLSSEVEAKIPRPTIDCIETSEQKSPDTILVKGVVLDGDTIQSNPYVGEPLLGVAITNLRTKKMVCSDLNGFFEIESAIGDTIQISYVGYISKIIPVTTGTKDLTISLCPSDSVTEGIMTIAFSSYGVFELNIIDEIGNPLLVPDVEIYKEYTDENGCKKEKSIIPEYDKDSKLKFYWIYNPDFQDPKGNPLKKVRLKIIADGYDKPQYVTIPFPKKRLTRTIRFRHNK